MGGLGNIFGFGRDNEGRNASYLDFMKKYNSDPLNSNKTLEERNAVFKKYLDDTDSMYDVSFKPDSLISGFGAISPIVKTATAVGEFGLAEDRYKFDKKMKEKEYAMAKDAYDRSKARAQNIGNQMTTYAS